jgi:signal transduction histidine kinase/ActR/RegA family two-component response regulator
VAVRPPRYSIRGRAALLTSVLVAVALTAFTWVTVARVRADLIKRGIERAETTAVTLATQTSQTSQQAANRLAQVAAGPAVLSFLREPNDQTKAAVLAAAHSPGATVEETVVIWDAEGRRLLDAVVGDANRTIPVEERPPSATGTTALQTQGNVLFTRSVAEIPGPRRGYLVLSRAVRPTASSNVVNRVVGDDAIVLIGNKSGDVWTDLTRGVPAPQIDLSQSGGREFLSADGEPLIGAPAVIPNTPWVLLIAFRRSVILAPAWQLLGVLIAASVGITIAATLAARALSNRVTKPLAELTHAVRALEQGDYSRRVLAQGQDEVGQLAHAFNAMAQQVEMGRRALEAHAAELTTSREAAKRANQSKDEFLAVLSHELRTPLNAILGWCQMLKSGINPPGGTPHAIAVIERNANAQLRLVEDLLDVSRIVTGQFVLEKGRVDINDVVKAAVESLEPALLAKKVKVEVNEAPRLLDRHVNGDANRLQQTVGNLLSNAIKFTPSGGLIRVELSSSPSSIEIAVRDNGEGISAAALPLIFDRLQQGDYGTARRHGGLGLGLAIVRQIVELHHGSVTAESEGLGHGATFRITLPTVPSPADAKPALALVAPVRDRTRVEERASIGGVHILLVEDSADARDVMERFLTISGAVVIACAEASSALEWLASNTPDVIVSDIGMPGLDGWGMMELIRSKPHLGAHGTPAIALTAHATPVDRERSMAAGFQEHLAKPVDVEVLLKAIARVSPRSSRERESQTTV